MAETINGRLSFRPTLSGGISSGDSLSGGLSSGPSMSGGVSPSGGTLSGALTMSGSGPSDYNRLANIPTIEGVQVKGDKLFADYGLEALTNLEIEALLQ